MRSRVRIQSSIAKPLMHDFAADLQAANAGPILKDRLKSAFRTSATLTPASSGVPNSRLASEVALPMLEHWQRRYASPKSLRCVVGDAGDEVRSSHKKGRTSAKGNNPQLQLSPPRLQSG